MWSKFTRKTFVIISSCRQGGALNPVNVDQSDEDGSPGAAGAVSAEGGAVGGNVDQAAGATGGGPSGVFDGVGVGHEQEQESESDLVASAASAASEGGADAGAAVDDVAHSSGAHTSSNGDGPRKSKRLKSTLDPTCPPVTGAGGLTWEVRNRFSFALNVNGC